MRDRNPRIWIESEGEAAQISRFVDLRRFSTIAIGKSGGRRDVGDGYFWGKFRIYDMSSRQVTDQIVDAGHQLTELVQFGIPDIVVSRGLEPLAAIELTSHKPTYNNLYQRFPKLVRPSQCGIPSYIFQLHDEGTVPAGKSALIKAAHRAQQMSSTPCIVYLYSDAEAEDVKERISALIEAYISNDGAAIDAFHERARRRSAPFLKTFDIRYFGGKTFEVHDDRVVANMRVVRNCDAIPGIFCGVNHCENAAAQLRTATEIRAGTHLKSENGGTLVKCVWITKGTGGLDPYPGYLLAGKLLLCTDETGRQVKPLIARFEKIPRDFWWWKSAESRLNNRLIDEIADSVCYQDEAV